MVRVFRSVEAADNRLYGDMLRDAPEFYNPSDVSNMLAMFGFNDVGQRPSLMRGLHQYVPDMNPFFAIAHWLQQSFAFVA